MLFRRERATTPTPNPYAAPEAVEARRPHVPAVAGHPRTKDAPANPWVSIWLAPRDTIWRIVSTDPTKRVFLLAAAGGAILSAAALLSVLGPRAPELLVGGLLASVVFGALLGVVLWLLGSFLCRATGAWLGGQATLAEVQAAYAWAQAPLFAAAPFVAAAALMFHFNNDADRLLGPYGTTAVLIATAAAVLVIGAWSLVILCKVVAEVNHFSAWHGLATVLLAWAVLIGPLLGVAAVVRWSAG